MRPEERRRTEAAMLLLEAQARRRLRAVVRHVVAQQAAMTPHNADAVSAAAHIGARLTLVTPSIVEDVRDQAAYEGEQRFRAEMHDEAHAGKRGAQAVAALLLSIPNPKRVTLRLSETIGRNLGHDYVKAVASSVGKSTRASDVDAAALERKAIADAEREAHEAVARIGGPYRAPARSASSHLLEGEAKVTAKVDTIAASEVSQSFNGARTALAEALEQRAASMGFSLYEEWSAVLDNRTCEVCFDLHGMIVPAGQAFDGYRPGDPHPRCRCQSFIVWTPGASKRAA